ncbi:MFS transporter [Lactobacillus sp. ESL0260]|uniref:MFS transporter n=1 Tax=Lactobacillus TaxID=1578 RepID=UPI000EFA68E5|nr:MULTISPECIES: MFS transporter [Lactobacillus]MBC6349549.1 MFS transporter [Lactobacillus melliventris]RMC60556.1 MFS transporter [Lactobacillus sp. ESL0260]
MDDKSVIQQSKKLMIAIMGISLVLSTSGAISGTIPLMEKHFANMPTSTVELIVTIPSFSGIFIPLLAGFIEKVTGKKLLALLGLGITAICGVIPVFTGNYWLILFSRIMVGVGISLLTPLSVSYITDIYEEKRANELLGYRNSFINIGSTVLLFLAGYLIKIGWHSAYWVFALAVIPFIMTLVWIPKRFDNYSVTVGEDVDQQKIKQTTNWQIIGYAVLFGIMQISYMGISLKIPSYIVNNHIGDSSTGSFILSLLPIAAIVSGLLYKYIYHVWQKNTTAFSATIAGLALGATLFSRNSYLIGACIMISGFFWGIMNPHMTELFALSSPKGSMTLSTSIVIFGINIGGTFAPFIFQFLGALFHNYSPEMGLIISALIWIIFGVVFLIVNLMLANKAKGDNKDA